MNPAAATHRPDFTSSLTPLTEPGLTALSEQLARVRGLGAVERAAICDGAAAALHRVLLAKVSRVLLVELNAARITGRLTAGDSAARWEQFLQMSATQEYWESLTTHYPTLRTRLDAVITRRCAAALTMAERLSADRQQLTRFLLSDPDTVTGVSFGAGDSHRGGHTVAVLEFGADAGPVVYKPRSLAVDTVLDDLLAALLPSQERIRVPAALSRGEYGWAEHVSHSYCSGPGELADFYRGIGYWLGVMRLLGGSDLHAENVIACGPVPVVIDCETLFTPVYPPVPSGLGMAVDQASSLVQATVLRTGMLPSRGLALGWRGVDASAVGSWRGEQPLMDMPVILDAGQDTARFGYERARATLGESHPSPDPALGDYWDQVVDGFTGITATLRALDRRGKLAPMLAEFAACPIRVVPRSTESYAELTRMLWHPASLSDPPTAVERAVSLLSQMAGNVAGSPSDSDVIAAEVAELLDGDIPFFATTPKHGRLTGPGGTAWLPEQDLIADSLARWRDADLGLDRMVIQATLVSAYLNDGWMPSENRLRPGPIRRDGPAVLDRRRREVLAAMMRQLRDSAIQADDGTVTWIAPVLHPTGWSVQPLGTDAYGGIAGVALLLAAHQFETQAGRADEIAGLDGLLTSALHTMRRAEDRYDRERVSGAPMRPLPPGLMIGIGSQIWVWLALERLGVAGPDGLARAKALAGLLPESAAAFGSYELLTGVSGAIVPLLQLAEATGQERWTREAVRLGDQVVAAARRDADLAWWASPRWPDGVGGFSHGATGIGWALARLALATGERRFADTAQAAFAFEETLYDRAGGWRDIRDPGEEAFAVAWCHGTVGIGIAAADLAARGWSGCEDVLARAARITDRDGFGWNHTLCHGDLGCWELLSIALAAGQAPAGLSQADLDARVIGSLEVNRPISGLAKDTYSPGLMAGHGGMAYQLLRMAPDADLPSVLAVDGPDRIWLAWNGRARLRSADAGPDLRPPAAGTDL